MKKTLYIAQPFIFTLLHVLLLIYSATAQKSELEKAHIEVSAEVMANIDLLTIRNLVFPDSYEDDDETFVSPILSENAGMMKVKGIPNSRIRINYISKVKLNSENDDGFIFIEYLVSGFRDENQYASGLINAVDAELTLNEKGEFFFWIGAKIDFSQTITGQFLGQFTIELEYM
jgi:hypothetical protein